MLFVLCRCENLKLPSMGTGEGYILETGELKGHLQAAEHKSIMQIMPLALLAAVHDTLGPQGAPLVDLVFRCVPLFSWHAVWLAPCRCMLFNFGA